MDQVAARQAKLNYEPKNTKTSEVCFNLKMGDVSRIVLEPGDMTRYEFYLIPQADDLITVGGVRGDVVVALVNTLQATMYTRIPFNEQDIDAVASYMCNHLHPGVGASPTAYYTCRIIASFLHRLGAA
jgi:hypothetical protein